MTAGEETQIKQTGEAYAHYTRVASYRNAKVACALVIILMPAGIVLDYFVYPTQVWFFLQLRLLCSALTAVVLVCLIRINPTNSFTPVLCAGWYALPAFFISWMISATEGAVSPYYAGLNLVILAVSSVIQATFVESLFAISLIFSMYLAACFLSPAIFEWRTFFNNSYFLTLTGIIVLTGNFFFNRLRLREFSLRYELDQSRKDLEESNRKLVELDAIKNRFFANVSHELRTPLTLLLAPLETLLQRQQGQFPAEIVELLNTMHANGMRLLKLINDLLDLVRLESGRVANRLVPVAVVDFIRGQVSAVQKTAENKGLTVTASYADSLGIASLDADKLEKILLNLLFNAIKFTPAGGQVAVHVERRNERLIIQIRDTGMGISAEKLPYIFDRFWQADNSSQRKYQGVGIGLALVKELVEAQNGTVAAKSQEGAGTEFTISLPYIEADAAPLGEIKDSSDQAAPKGATDEWISGLYRRAELFPSITPLRPAVQAPESYRVAQRARVLIADDEPDMLRFLRSQLSAHFEVIDAIDGQQAVEKAAQYLPDLILVDMMMPIKDGIEVCRELRERVPTRNIPIVLLTAWAEEETKLRALTAGANDFLTKPFSTTELHVRLKNLIDGYHAQKHLARQKQILEATLEQLKETEAQLVHSEKLASLGRLSAGIIHEINNPLNFAKTGMFSLKSFAHGMEGAAKEDYCEILADIQQGLDRVQNITSDLYRFSHPDIQQLEEVTVASLFKTALRMLSHELKDKVKVEQHFADELTVWCNAVQVNQVLVNLLQNAIYAATHRATGDGREPTITISAEEIGGECLIRVRDNGCGIAAGDLTKIFDPFFTTKEVGEGMGLGLSICHRIMEQHHGRITVNTEPGKYCEIVLKFPEEATPSMPIDNTQWRANGQHL